MTLLVTGATGFVMSVLARQWLEADPAARLVVLDAAPPGCGRAALFRARSTRASRSSWPTSRSPDSWRAALAGARHHAHRAWRHHHADLARHGGRGAARARGRESRADHRRQRDGHGGDARVGAHAAAACRRFIYVSSGAVYKHHGPDRPGEPLPEDGYVMPRRLYGISKLASELITERYGDCSASSTASVRPSSVYGTMDRVTASRNYRHVPNRIAHMALDGHKRVRVNTLDAVGDYIHAEDVARAIIVAAARAAPALQRLQHRLRHGRQHRRHGGLGGRKGARLSAPRSARPSRPTSCRIRTLTDGMWGAYDISRITAETGWRPRPVREALHAYMDWIAAQRRAGA